MKTSEERHYAPGGVDLVALWETGDNLGGAPVFKGKAKPGANRWVRRAGALPMNWAAVAAGLMVLTLVPFMAQEGSRPPALDEGSPLDGVLGVDPFVAEAGAGAMSPGFPSDGSDVQRAQDPSLMVLGPERPGVATAASPASAPTDPASKASGATDWAAALKNAVRTAAPAAVKKAGLPSPSARLAGALKALAGGAGSSASKITTGPGEALRLSAPSSKDLLSSFKAMDSLQLRRSEPLLRSMARGGSTPSSISQGGAAFNSSARPSGGATASENLRDAVAAFGSPSANGQGGGGPAVFDGGRGPGANPAGAAKAPGESLEFQRRKMEMEKEMDLKYAKRKYNELGRQEMLDKVNAESAAKMKETVAGKLIDGAFGLAQKAMGGEGGGKGGGDDSAVAANERAEAARRRLDGSSETLGQNGNALESKGQELIRTDDKVLGRRLGRPVENSGEMLNQAKAAHLKVSAKLGETDKSLDLSHKAIAKGNEATDKQVQGIQKYVDATGQRIDGWNIDLFNPGSPAIGQLAAPDAQGPLGEAGGKLSQAKGQHGQAIAAASLAPPTLAPNVKAVDGVIGSIPASQRSRFTSFDSLRSEMAAREGELQGAIRDAQTAIGQRAVALEKSAAAKEAAGGVSQEASGLKTDLQQFEASLGQAIPGLSKLSVDYNLLKVTQPSAAQGLKQIFDATKQQASAGLQARAAKIEPLRQKLKEAERKLGEAK